MLKSRSSSDPPLGEATYEQAGSGSRRHEPVLSRDRFEGIDVFERSERFSLPYFLRAGVAHGFEKLRKLSTELSLIVAPAVSEFGFEGGGAHAGGGAKTEPSVTLAELCSQLGSFGTAAAVLGLSDDGHPVVLDFDDLDVSHVLISGVQGCGKTTLLTTLALSLAAQSKQSHIQLVIIDPSERGHSSSYASLEPLSYLPHMLAPVVFGHAPALETLSLLVDELEYRQAQEIVFPHVVVMIENVVELLDLGGSHASALLARISQHGRDAGIQLVLTTDQPDSPLLDELLKANLPVRIVGMVPDEQVANAASGVVGSGAEYLSAPGEFMASLDGDVTVCFRSLHVGSQEMHVILTRLQRNRPRPLLARPLSERVELISGDPAGQHDGYPPSVLGEDAGELAGPPWDVDGELERTGIYDAVISEIDET